MFSRSTYISLLLLLGFVCLSSVSCVSPTPDTVIRTEPIDQRDTPWKADISAEQDFSAERDYIVKRRQAAGVATNQETIALCFSGGGLRAGTIQLGVLQGLEQADLLRKADYLSSVSGGSYIASWYVTHLLHPDQPENEIESSKRWGKGGGMSYVKDRSTLLQLDRSVIDPAQSGEGRGGVEELEDNRGFVFGQGNLWLPVILPAHIMTMPVNLLFDVALHYKPTRGKFNLYHPTFLYKSAIHTTYLTAPSKLLIGQEFGKDGFFDGKPHQIRLPEINPDGHQAPYLVLNAALANNPHPEIFFNREVGPFEFSRYGCGAPFLGYIHSRHFGFPVLNVRDGANGSGEVVLRANSAKWISSTTDPLKLADAVAASGAALDSNAGGKVDKSPHMWPPVNGELLPEKKPRLAGLFDVILKPLNLNLRVAQRNFSMQMPGGNNGAWTAEDLLRDRLREITTDRISTTVHSNSLTLSDGAHFDNLGVFAMTQRKTVKEIWSFDATQDGKYKFSSWKNLVKLLEGSGWKVCKAFPNQPRLDAEENPEAVQAHSVFQFELTKPGRKIDLYLVKSSFRPGDTHFRKDLRPGQQDDLQDWFQAYREKKSTGKKFPHTSTANLSFKRGDFNAYRELGRILALQLAEKRR